jgi:hypothetical protein
MHLCGITAEDRSGASKIQLTGQYLLFQAPFSGFPVLELAKGFEPPTL